MRLLSDLHHSDLAESHQLVFGDRLGWEVYFPYGMAWFDEDYWAFERNTFGDAVARQYLLGIWSGAEPDANGVVRAPDPRHRGRTLTGLTLDAARDLRPDLVMSSVPANAIGLRRFAREVDARWLMHIGNQWGNDDVLGLRPDGLILTTTSDLSTDVPRVIVHQEFSLADFRYEAPVGFGPVASFVNGFPENTACNHLPSGGEYGIFTRLAAASPEFDWRVYGAYGTAPLDAYASGAIEGTHLIGDAMRAASVGYHSKHWSDGFGHVIHNWFAVGRPVLGHARYYADKLAGPLWVEGETSFDIEGRSDEQVLGLLARMRDEPDWHAELCANAAARFREIVDFDADARAIEGLIEQVLDPVAA